MQELDLCHWLLYEPSGICRSVFAPSGDSCEGYRRLGPKVSSSQFVLPLVFAAKEFSGPEIEQRLSLKITFMRDDKNQPGLAFSDMPALKVVTLISELARVMVDFIAEIGIDFRSLEISEAALMLKVELKEMNDYGKLRSVEVMKAGIEMMAFARGLKVAF